MRVARGRGPVHPSREQPRQRVTDRLERPLEESARELRALLAVSRTVSSTLELEPLLGVILEQLRSVVDYSAAAVLAFGDEGETVLDYRGPLPRERVIGYRGPSA